MKFVKYVGIFVLFLVVAFGGLIVFAPKNIHYNIKKEINAPVSSTWDVAMDPDRMGEWLEGCESVKLVKGNGEVGSKYEVTFNEEGQKMVMQETVTGYEEGKLYAFKGVVKDFMEIESEMHFEAIDSTRSKLIVHTTIIAKSPLMRIYLYNKEGSKTRADFQYETLKQMIEAL